MKFGDLALEIARDNPRAERLEAAHLGLDPASCESARGPDADRRDSILISLTSRGSLHGSDALSMMAIPHRDPHLSERHREKAPGLLLSGVACAESSADRGKRCVFKCAGSDRRAVHHQKCVRASDGRIVPGTGNHRTPEKNMNETVTGIRLRSVYLPLKTPISDAKVLTGRQKPMTEIAIRACRKIFRDRIFFSSQRFVL